MTSAGYDETGRDLAPWDKYRSLSARQARDRGYGSRDYHEYLDAHACELAARFLMRGEHELAREMLTRSLGAALAGNDGA